MNKPVQNESDMMSLLTKMQAQLSALERKMDSLTGKVLSRLTEAKPAVQQSIFQPSSRNNATDDVVHAYAPISPASTSTPLTPPPTPLASSTPQANSGNGRTKHQAVCAECKKDCELPFKPTGDRPVYCNECFAARRAARKAKYTTAKKPQEPQPVAEAVSPEVKAPESPAVEIATPVPAKKSAAKKTVAKKPAVKKPSSSTKSAVKKKKK